MVSKKILVLGTPNSGKLTFLKELTGILPDISSETRNHAGIVHQIEFKTKYYNKTVDIWIDEFKYEEIEQWIKPYLSEEASQVREVLGAIIIVFKGRKEPKINEYVIKQVKEIRRIVEACGPLWDGVLLVVKVPEKDKTEGNLTKYIEDEALLDACYNEGFEYVDLLRQSTKESKEGIERVREALEAYVWDEKLSDCIEDFFNENNDENKNEKGSEKDIEEFEKLASKIMVLREQANSLPLSERQRFILNALR
ncbi:hypothetical protein T552_00909 [Pneumocystis carinii B80]|uniref:Increased recombination centers protein 6 n=1 Tax=Pneumocystis carinii (strain B80) TaxID=1408658 RepID=A0A0W4ZMU8_PNEC8|nr:hypothetical protein T552_00909 [Pneumocystis carinii B80]KTW29701.1 hypothetical protein T552_00909 [Pneumocystis carinii B80]